MKLTTELKQIIRRKLGLIQNKKVNDKRKEMLKPFERDMKKVMKLSKVFNDASKKLRADIVEKYPNSYPSYRNFTDIKCMISVTTGINYDSDDEYDKIIEEVIVKGSNNAYLEELFNRLNAQLK